MNKTQQITELKAALAKAHANIDGLNIEARRTATERDRQAAARKADHDAYVKLQKDRAKREAEQATLKSIRNGMIPVEALRGVTSQDYSTQHNKTRTLTSLTVNLDGKNPVATAILDALLAPEPQDGVLKVKYTLAEPSVDFGSSWGAASTLTPPVQPRFKAGDRVNVQTIPNGLGYLVSGPIV